MSAHMERFLHQIGRSEVPESKRILELNAEHAAVQAYPDVPVVRSTDPVAPTSPPWRRRQSSTRRASWLVHSTRAPIGAKKGLRRDSRRSTRRCNRRISRAAEEVPAPSSRRRSTRAAAEKLQEARDSGMLGPERDQWMTGVGDKARPVSEAEIQEQREAWEEARGQ